MYGTDCETTGLQELSSGPECRIKCVLCWKALEMHRKCNSSVVCIAWAVKESANWNLFLEKSLHSNGRRLLPMKISRPKTESNHYKKRTHFANELMSKKVVYFIYCTALCCALYDSSVQSIAGKWALDSHGFSFSLTFSVLHSPVLSSLLLRLILYRNQIIFFIFFATFYLHLTVSGKSNFGLY